MDIKGMKKNLFYTLKKYRYVLLVLAIGLVLMIIPGKSRNETNNDSNIAMLTQSEPTLEEKLSTILSQVSGAGKVEVLLTVAKGEETVYQTNDDISNSNDTNNNNSNTVMVTDAQRNQYGLIRQIIPAEYQGAVVICQGADDPNVRLAMVNAVSNLTGLGANCISVLKMK